MDEIGIDEMVKDSVGANGYLFNAVKCDSM